MLLHFSHDPSIRRFRPHVPTSNPTAAPAVWAIDEDHAPLYWFPRDCPRVTVWARDAQEHWLLSRLLATDARRVHACELAWVERLRAASLFVYRFAPDGFRPLESAAGHWTCDHEVEPLDVAPVGDLIDRHVEAGIELRLVPALWPLHDLVVGSGLEFSIVRMANAVPRSSPHVTPG